jgi:hypothetical protein
VEVCGDERSDIFDSNRHRAQGGAVFSGEVENHVGNMHGVVGVVAKRAGQRAISDAASATSQSLSDSDL